MRHIILKQSILSLFIFVLTSGCNLKEKLEEITTFNITNRANFSVPSSSPLGDLLNLNTPNIESSSQQSFENNNTRADLVKEVRLTDLTLTITDPADEDFSFLQEMRIYISNESAGETLLAEKTDIPDNIGNTLTLDATGEQLDAYIKESSYDLRYELVTDETNPSMDMQAEMVFQVRADVL
jgi:ABC-type Fe3+-hydroxamate transport system substrate-binding protein